MALNKRERVLLVTTITLLAIGGNFFLVSPLAKNWTALKRGLTNQRRELAAMQATIQRKSDWQREYDKLRHGLGQRTQRFQQPSDVLKKIEDVGTASGVVITARRPMTPVERDVYRELPVQCTIEAKTESLVKFLYELQTGSGLISIEQIQVTQQPNNILRCDIQIRALSSKSEARST
jgi:Tfp pilus assembly protein PilO